MLLVLKLPEKMVPIWNELISFEQNDLKRPTPPYRVLKGMAIPFQFPSAYCGDP